MTPRKAEGEAIRVLLVDDHQVVRQGLRKMLDGEKGIEVVGDAGSAEEILAEVELLSPDIVLMDIRMPGMGGIEATRQLKAKQPECSIIVLTLYGEYLPQAIEAGAVGYLLKNIKREELSQAIRAVYRGQSPLDLSLSRELFAQFAALASSDGRPRGYLAAPEREILRLIASGASNREIGDRLFMSTATVKRGVRRIFDKLEVRSRSQAVAEAYKRRLI